jgi:beta-glucosidase
MANGEPSRGDHNVHKWKTVPVLVMLELLMACLLMACKDPLEPGVRRYEVKDFNETYEPVIDSIIGLLTLDEKIALLHGNGMFTSAGVERLGIPELHYSDGPFGIREEILRDSWGTAGWTNDSATYLPTGTALAATWNPELACKYGQTLGMEARKRNKDIFLGPAINIIRTPLNGRNFEYFSEDPLLNARISVSYIQGVQSQDVAACVKHFAANNQETHRGTIDVIMDQRTLREIYLPAFKASVLDGHVFSVMGSYNKCMGYYCCENSFLLKEILKHDWGFKGAVISDWSAVHSTLPSAENGLDVEMGTLGPYREWYFADPLATAVQTGLLGENVINDKVRRVLRIIYNCKVMEADRKQGSINTVRHSETAYNVASESIVLLKNERSILPLRVADLESIAVIGDNATRKHAYGGFGASVKAKYEVTPLAGLKNALQGSVDIRYARGYEKRSRVIHDGNLRRVIQNEPDTLLVEEAVRVAKASDVAIIFAGLNHDFDTEALDREDFALPYGQDQLIRQVARANPNTIVVIIAGSPVDLSAVNHSVGTIIWGWLNGCEAGNAMADVILGKTNPSGKLPFTIPVSLEDSPAHALDNFPGEGAETEYTEGILVGYRWFDTKDIDPQFCFGHGLSYSTFSLNSMETDQTEYGRDACIRIWVGIANTGPVPGQQTIQLYVTDPESSVPKPAKALKSFRKVMLHPGEEASVEIRLNTKDLAYFNNSSGTWIIEPGEYRLLAGFSSRDIRLDKTIKIY